MAQTPSRIRPGRLCDAHDGPVTLFLIGMRINRLSRPDKWLPVARAMPRMLKELSLQPELGLLGHEVMLSPVRTLITLQYWRDFDALHAYAHATEREHLPAWRDFNRASKGNDAVGIFHETYVVQPGAHESIYVAMPPFGLGKASGLREATGKRSAARERMGGVG
ncbi:MAG TPA: DUF4188 domain-containing protein [Sphingobium sp.]